MEFACGDGTCITLDWKCDSMDDCGNNADEADCEPKCDPATQFSCGNANGTCIDLSWKCDNMDDCGNNADEADCDDSDGGTGGDEAPKECNAETEFDCGNGKCI